MSAFNEAIQGNKPVLVDFYADWCQPCKIQAPILKEVIQKLHDSARILKINVDSNPQVAQKYNIKNIPTLLLFKNGNLVWRGAGVHQANQLLSIIKTHL